MMYHTVEEEFERFEKVIAGGLPRSFPLEFYHDFSHNLYILRYDPVRCRAVLGTKHWLWLEPIFKSWDWIISQWYGSWFKVIRFLGKHGWMKPEPGIILTPYTALEWFAKSPKVEKVKSWVTAWLRWKN